MWLMTRKPLVVPIFGTNKIAHVDENVAASRLVLNAEELSILDGTFAGIVIEGASSGPSQLVAIDVGAKDGTSSTGGHGSRAIVSDGAKYSLLHSFDFFLQPWARGYGFRQIRSRRPSERSQTQNGVRAKRAGR